MAKIFSTLMAALHLLKWLINSCRFRLRAEPARARALVMSIKPITKLAAIKDIGHPPRLEPDQRRGQNVGRERGPEKDQCAVAAQECIASGSGGRIGMMTEERGEA